MAHQLKKMLNTLVKRTKLDKALSEGTGSGASTTDKPGQARFSKGKANYSSVIRHYTPKALELFGAHSCSINTMEVPARFAQQCADRGMWVRAPDVKDDTNESAFDLVRVQSPAVPGVSNSLYSTPQKGSPNIRTDAIFSGSSNETALQCRVDAANSKVSLLQAELIGLNQRLAELKSARTQSLVQVRSDISNVKDDISVAKEEARAASDDLRSYITKKMLTDEAEFDKYLTNCPKMIGFLIEKCDDTVKMELEASQDYADAFRNTDVVRVNFMIKSFTLGTNNNIEMLIYTRNAELMAMGPNSSESVNSFADRYLVKYREFVDMGGDNSDSTESNRIYQLMNVYREKYPAIIEPWFSVNKKNRPSTVSEFFNILKEVESSSIPSVSPPRKKQKTEEVTEGDAEALYKSFAAFVRGGRGRGGRGDGRFGGRDGRFGGRGGRDGRFGGRDGRGRGNNYPATGQCFAFLQGRCSRGDSCKYSHSTNNNNSNTNNNTSNKPTSTPGASYCKFILQEGKCNAGEKCFFASCHAASLDYYNKYAGESLVRNNTF